MELDLKISLNGVNTLQVHVMNGYEREWKYNSIRCHLDIQRLRVVKYTSRPN
jgi:hypothetical protein